MLIQQLNYVNISRRIHLARREIMPTAIQYCKGFTNMIKDRYHLER